MVERPLKAVCGKDVGELEFGTWKAVERYKQNLMDHYGGGGDFKVKSTKSNVDSKGLVRRLRRR